MPPNNTNQATGILFEEDTQDASFRPTIEAKKLFKADDRKLEIVWKNIAFFIYLHVAALYGAYLFLTTVSWTTAIYGYLVALASGFGITAGAHRLWSHRSYKAKLPLRIMLTIFNTMAFQGSVINWCRDHRMHHKYSETDADPHNSTRGFFFSHVGWLLCKKHPEIKEKGYTIDMSDLYSDPILRFQQKYYIYLMPVMCFILPMLVPVYFWNESLSNSWHVVSIFRYVWVLNSTWLVNSAAHMFGHRPYDKYIKPVENMTVSAMALGEGFHNYHHSFPWDYKTAELGGYSLNFTKAFIDTMAKIGWAYDLKTATKDLVEKRTKRTGDGTHEVWGWGDKDQSQDEINQALIIHRKVD